MNKIKNEKNLDLYKEFRYYDPKNTMLKILIASKIKKGKFLAYEE